MYMNTTKCYICGKPLKRDTMWEYTRTGLPPRYPFTAGNYPNIFKYGDHVFKMLPKCIISKLYGLYNLANSLNTLQVFAKGARDAIAKDLGDDFKWNILRKILQGEEKPSKKKRKEPFNWYFFRDCIRSVECEHIFSIFTAMQHMWIIRAPGEGEYVRAEYEKTHRGCNRIKTDLSLIQFNSNGDIVLDQTNVNNILNGIINNAQDS